MMPHDKSNHGIVPHLPAPWFVADNLSSSVVWGASFCLIFFGGEFLGRLSMSAALEAGTISAKVDPAQRPKAQNISIQDTSRLLFRPDPQLNLKIDGGPRVLSFSPDGKILVGIGVNQDDSESKLICWNTTTWAIEREVVFKREIIQATFTPDGRWLLLSAKGASKIALIDPVTLGPKGALHTSGEVCSMSPSPDSKSVATISGGEWKVQLWDLKSRNVSKTFNGPGTPTTHIAYSSDGNRLATTGHEGIQVWIAKTGARDLAIPPTKPPAAFHACWSPDDRQIAAGGIDGQVRIWDAASGRIHNSLTTKQPAVFAVQFSPDGGSLLTRSVKWFDPNDRQSVLGAVAAGSDVCVWNLATKEPQIFGGDVCLLHPHSLAFSPNGQMVAATRNDSIGVWIGVEKPAG
jgi:WD40 repeat protein